MSSFELEVVLHWLAVACYIVATAALAASVWFERPSRLPWAIGAALAGLVPHSIALIHRWIVSGHGPYMLRYEVLSSNAWVAVVLLLLFLWRRPRWGAVGLVVLPAAIIATGLALFSNREIRDLPPTLRSMWLVFHIICAKLASAGFLLATAAALVLLIKRSKPDRPVLARLPSIEALDAYVLRFVGFGFVFWTTSVAAGAIWANESWGRYWGWDAIETWSLVTWLAYGALLHARRLFKLRGPSVAWATLACFAIVLLTVFILPFVMPSIHAAYFQ